MTDAKRFGKENFSKDLTTQISRSGFFDNLNFVKILVLNPASKHWKLPEFDTARTRRLKFITHYILVAIKKSLVGSLAIKTKSIQFE